MKKEIFDLLTKVQNKEFSITDAQEELLRLFSFRKSFYCHDEFERGRCDSQCSWCVSNTPDKWMQ